MPKKYRVTIDRDQCIADMACVALCPQVFEMSEEDGKSQIVEQYRVEGKLGEGVVPEELFECVKTAADACPIQIISVEELSE